MIHVGLSVWWHCMALLSSAPLPWPQCPQKSADPHTCIHIARVAGAQAMQPQGLQARGPLCQATLWAPWHPTWNVLQLFVYWQVRTKPIHHGHLVHARRCEKTLDPLGNCGISKLRQKMALWASPSNAEGAQSQHMQWLAKPVPVPSRSPHVNFFLLLMERPDTGGF